MAIPLVVTLGDPLSINIEVLASILGDASPSHPLKRPVVLIGSHWQWCDQVKALDADTFPVRRIDRLDFSLMSENKVYFFDPSPAVANNRADQLSLLERGQLAVAALHAIPLTYEQRFAVLTSPIDKAAAHAAGFKHQGQTEYFEKIWSGESVMLLAGPKLKVGLTTNHLPLRDVSQAVSKELIIKKIGILCSHYRRIFKTSRLRIAVASLNPHAGDHGLFGSEDDHVVRPAVLEASKMFGDKSTEIVGPIPADTVFYRCYQGEFDCVLSQYHDQGLGPLKTVHFDEAVNVTLGLKNLRVSPDHGPASDLYLKGQASQKSFRNAFGLCESWLATID